MVEGALVDQSIACAKQELLARDFEVAIPRVSNLTWVVVFGAPVKSDLR
jgi:hypothetical protein